MRFRIDRASLPVVLLTLIGLFASCTSPVDGPPRYEPWSNAPGFFVAVGEPIRDRAGGDVWAVFDEDSGSWRMSVAPSELEVGWLQEVRLDESVGDSLPDRYRTVGLPRPDCGLSGRFSMSPMVIQAGLHVCVAEAGSDLEVDVLNSTTGVVPLVVRGQRVEGSIGPVSRALRGLSGDASVFLLAGGESASWVVSSDETSPLVGSVPSWAAAFGTAVQVLVDGLGVDSDGVTELVRCFGDQIAVFEQLGADIADVSVFSGFTSTCATDIAGESGHSYVGDAAGSFIRWYEQEAAALPGYEFRKEAWPEVIVEFSPGA